MPMTDAIEAQAYEGWAILELMGHRRLGGYIRQVEMYGAALCRIDIPGDEGTGGAPLATQFYSASAIYCVTPTDRATAMRVAAAFRPEPVSEWQLPKLPSPQESRIVETLDEDDEPGDPDDDDFDA
jgi:hypothetical protein